MSNRTGWNTEQSGRRAGKFVDRGLDCIQGEGGERQERDERQRGKEREVGCLKGPQLHTHGYNGDEFDQVAYGQ